MAECNRKMFLGGPACRFEARYDIGPSQLSMEGAEGSASRLIELSERFRPKTYVRDVCVNCGRTIERMEVQDAFMEGHDEGLMK